MLALGKTKTKAIVFIRVFLVSSIIVLSRSMDSTKRMGSTEMKTDLSLLEDMSLHDMEDHTIAPTRSKFDALVEVSIVAREKLKNFQRLFQEKALKKPVSVPVGNKQSRFGDDDDDQDWSLESEWEPNKKNPMQEKVLMNTAVPVPNRARFRDQQHLEPPPNLPQKFKDVIKEMGGSDELLVIQKKLFVTDTNTNKNRFSIPFGQIPSKDFLTEVEKKKLREGQKIKAPLIDPELQSHDIFLVQRNNPDVYVLRNTWNNVHTSNELNVGYQIILSQY